MSKKPSKPFEPWEPQHPRVLSANTYHQAEYFFTGRDPSAFEDEYLSEIGPEYAEKGLMIDTLRDKNKRLKRLLKRAMNELRKGEQNE